MENLLQLYLVIVNLEHIIIDKAVNWKRLSQRIWREISYVRMWKDTPVFTIFKQKDDNGLAQQMFSLPATLF